MKTREFDVTLQHPMRLIVLVNQNKIAHELEPGAAIEFAFPVDSEADREALTGWAHAMRFFADSVLGEERPQKQEVVQ